MAGALRCELDTLIVSPQALRAQEVTMTTRRSARFRQQQIAHAFESLKKHPRFPGVYLKIHEGLAELDAKAAPSIPRLTRARLAVEVAKFSIHAEAYLALVDDLPSQEVFALVLEGLAKNAWQQYSGMPLEGASPDDLLIFRQLVSHWTAESYRRIATPHAFPQTADAPAQEDSAATQRQAFIDPILAKKGLTRSKWASRAGVDPSVVYGYMDGTSSPRADTRKALADVLGVEASDLPQ